MTDGATREVLDALGLRAAPEAGAPSGGMSTARLIPARTPEGRRAVVKVSALEDATTRDAALRELAVHEEVARHRSLPAPRLLSAHRTTGWLAIALPLHHPAPPATSWTADRWIDLARLLATLHTGTGPVPAVLRRPRPVDEERPADPEAFARRLWSGPGDVARLAVGTSLLEELRAEAATGPPVLTHGDCHLGNLLEDERGHLLLTDWQASVVGPPASDLAFALTRAVPTGAAVPRGAVIAAYSEATGADPRVTARRVTAHQLLVLLTQYPAFASLLDEVEVQRLRALLDELLAAWTRDR